MTVVNAMIEIKIPVEHKFFEGRSFSNPKAKKYGQ